MTPVPCRSANHIRRAALAVVLLPLALLASATAPARAATTDTPADYALHIALPARPGAALLSVELPEAAYRAMREPALGDLRVFNAAGEALPVAVLPPAPEVETLHGEAPLLPLPLPPTNAGAAFQGLAIERDAGGRLTRLALSDRSAPATRPQVWIADLLDFPHSLSAVTLRWTGSDNFTGNVQLEGSDDLVQWRPLVAAAPLMSVRQGERQLSRVRIPLPDTGRVRYLRLSWPGVPPDLLPTALALESERTIAPPPARWLSLKGRRGEVRGEFRYTAPGLFPVIAAAPDFADANTVTTATLLAHARRKDPWSLVARGTLHQLQDGTGKHEDSAPLRFAPRRDPLWLLRLDRRTAPRQAPALRLGWTPETIVFPARGAGPYTLAAGRSGASPLLYPVAEVVPDYGGEHPAAITPVDLDDTTLPEAPAPDRDAPAWRDTRNLSLWAVLVLAVAALAAMAYSLLRKDHSGH